jgi:DnaK suppressor protein
MSDATAAPHCPVTVSDKTYLTEAQLNEFKDYLLAWRSELCQALPGRQDDALAERLPDWVDSAALSTQIELSMVDRARAMELIRQIDAALGRIAAGTYGYCAISGEEIGIDRLRALPTAVYCVETQNEIERRKRRLR